MAVTFGVFNPIVVGAIVYRAFNPKRCGIVVDPLPPFPGHQFDQRVNVRWLIPLKKGVVSALDSVVEEVYVRDLCCYRSLMLDHRRKADNMAGVIELVESLGSGRCG